ncbi:DNA repair exonuclease [Proteobacteria bacterium 005FR1]|nr:DNA repair exonuclease [Proteobacteria bacterium 005FR1]
MPRFLHTADWQIGRTYNRLEAEDAAALSEARFAAVERLTSLATEEGCDLVLVAGDVFDAQTVSDRTIRRTFNAMAAFSGPWVLLPGNHDAALAESVWTRARRLKAVPDNVHLALEPGVLELPDQGVAVLAAPLTQRHTYDDLTAAFDQLETSPGLLRLGLAHGCVQGVLAEDIDSANPIAADRAERARLDYLALGDWHGARQIDSRTWYSGTPEPERFRNNDAGYVLVVDIPAAGAEPAVTAHRTGQHEWQQLHETLTVESDLDAFVETLATVPPNAVLDIRLEGEITLAGEAKLEQALSEAEARHRSLRCKRSQLRLQPTEDDIASLQADGYLAEVIQELRAMPQEAEDSPAREALAILAGLLRERRADSSSEASSSREQASPEPSKTAED